MFLSFALVFSLFVVGLSQENAQGAGHKDRDVKQLPLTSLAEPGLKERNASKSEVKAMKGDITILKSKLQSLERQMRTQQTLDNSCKDILRKLSKSNVAFEVTQVKHPATVSGNQIIRFDSVVLNNGGGYHASTGVFEAPVSGTYLFWANVLPIGGGIHLKLMKEGRLLTIGHSPSHNIEATITYMANVKKGEKVWFLSYDYRRNVYGDYHSNYGGSLIHLSE